MAQTTLGMSSKNGVVEFTNLQTLVNDAGGVAAAQKVITLDDTTGMAAGDTLEYMLIGGIIEQNVIDTVDTGVQVTMIANVGAGGIADDQQVNKIVLISGCATSVNASGGNRKMGEAFTGDGDTPLLTSGKREAIDVTVKGIYTEDTGTPSFYEELQAAYESDAGLGLRWSPTAYDTAGQKRFWTTDTAGSYIKLMPVSAKEYPALDFASADPLMIEFTVHTEAIGTTDHS